MEEFSIIMHFLCLFSPFSSWCPTDVKLATGSDDATARVWDFARCVEERVLRGHGADVRSVDWHPTKGGACFLTQILL